MNEIKRFSSYKESIDNDRIWDDIYSEVLKHEKIKNKLKFGRFAFNPKTKEESLKLQKKLLSFGYKWAVYEKEPAHVRDKNGIILAPFNTKEEAEIASKKYGYYGDNYYIDIINPNL
jgi:hypothetical protein